MLFRHLLCVRIEIDQLLCVNCWVINSLFVGQVYEDKSHGLCTQDLIFFTTDFQTVNSYLTIHAHELIYILSIIFQSWF